MNYDQLVAYVKTPRKDYYEQLVKASHEILKAYQTRTQAQLGKELNLHQAQMGVVLKMLIAIEAVTDEQTTSK